MEVEFWQEKKYLWLTYTKLNKTHKEFFFELNIKLMPIEYLHLQYGIFSTFFFFFLNLEEFSRQYLLRSSAVQYRRASLQPCMSYPSPSHVLSAYSQFLSNRANSPLIVIIKNWCAWVTSSFSIRKSFSQGWQCDKGQISIHVTLFIHFFNLIKK